MKEHVWDLSKNLKLIRERGISFEEIAYQIEHGGLLDLIDHPNRFILLAVEICS
jgi:hypothetical protein